MKLRLIALFCIISLILAIPAFAVEYKDSGDAAPGTPVLDAKMDPAYLTAEKLEIKNFGNFANSGNDSHLSKMATGFAYVLWDTENLYFYFDITDTTKVTKSYDTKSTDAVEMSIDFDSTKSGTYGAGRYFVKYSAYAHLDSGNGIFDGGDNTKMAAALKDDGYIIECSVKIPAGFKAEKGASIGLAISVLDDVDDDGKRDLKITWGKNDGEVKAMDMLNNPACQDKLIFADAKPLPVETTAAKAAPAGDAAAAAKAPATFDITIAAAALVCGVMVPVIRRQRRSGR